MLWSIVSTRCRTGLVASRFQIACSSTGSPGTPTSQYVTPSTPRPRADSRDQRDAAAGRDQQDHGQDLLDPLLDPRV